jgi:predicted acyltransferase
VATVDGLGWKYVFFVFLIFGVNSIAIYCLSHLIDKFIKSSLITHLGRGPFQVFNEYGPQYEHLFMGIAIMMVLWLILFWMYRRKLFLKI